MPPLVILLVGWPGSGKSTYAAARGWPTLSSDAMRCLLADDEADQSIHQQVFQTLRFVLAQRLILARPLTCVDATSLTAAERWPYLVLARQLRAEVEAVWLDVPYEVCGERNRQRARVVPEEAMERMRERFEEPRMEEGFVRVTRVSGTPSSPDA